MWLVRSAPAVMGYGAALSVVLAAFTYTGGKLTGYERDPAVDEVSRKEYLRKNRRRPVDEIVNELGEGRGMCWACDAMQTRSFHFGSHLLIDMQEFTRPATRSVGHSASRPTTALMFPPLLLRKYVSYTHTSWTDTEKVSASATAKSTASVHSHSTGQPLPPDHRQSWSGPVAGAHSAGRPYRQGLPSHARQGKAEDQEST